MEKHRHISCQCLHDNVFLESLVIVLTLISGLAITGKNLLLYNLITVPKFEDISSSNTNATTENTMTPAVQLLQENEKILHMLDKIFLYTSFAIAVLFMVEIFLKVITLRTVFLTKPWQIFDGLVVAGALGVEIAFYFLSFSEPGLHSVRYVVMLRLWRIPFVCTIHSKVIQQNLERDLERYRIKSEEKISQMQHTIAEQGEKICHLQTMADKNTKKITTENNNSKPRQLGSAGSDGVNKQLKNSSFFKKQMLKATFEETSINEGLSPEKSTAKINTCDSLDEREFADSNIDNSDSDNDVVLRRLPRSDASYDLKNAAERPKTLHLQPRKRSSSASEYINYSHTSFSEKDTAVSYDKDKHCSQSSEENIVDQSNKENNKQVTSSEKQSISPLDSPSDIADANDSDRQFKTRQRRLTSCPEYVYTQRMSITNDESKLISDGTMLDDPSMYDNMAFLSDEQIGLQILAEFDGVKTYRNENGIPMTSL
ncbi:hypothetical protein Btru_002345 [Bulinus truncatus]|nr:hypothetical protein Btru_002345 [Bulinus truncatus]